MQTIDINFIKECLFTEEANYARATSEKAKLNHLYSIIMFKSQLQEYDSIYLYKDIKQYINHAVSCIDSEMYGYDKLNRDALVKLIIRLDKKQKLEISSYMLRRIKQAGIADEEVWALAMFKKNEMIYLLTDGWNDNNRVYNTLKLILCTTSYNLLALLVWFVIAYFILFILLLPAWLDCFQFFEIQYHDYFEGQLANHSANILSLLLGMQNDLKVSPINVFGFALIAIGKIFIIVVVVNYAMKQLEKRLNA